jgi:hypothetical protein
MEITEQGKAFAKSMCISRIVEDIIGGFGARKLSAKDEGELNRRGVRYPQFRTDEEWWLADEMDIRYDIAKILIALALSCESLEKARAERYQAHLRAEAERLLAENPEYVILRGRPGDREKGKPPTEIKLTTVAEVEEALARAEQSHAPNPWILAVPEELEDFMERYSAEIHDEYVDPVLISINRLRVRAEMDKQRQP